MPKRQHLLDFLQELVAEQAWDDDDILGIVVP
jgi:hypothetical protein